MAHHKKETIMETILVPLDGSPFGEHALPAALAIARRRPTRIALAHVHQLIIPTIAAAEAPLFDQTPDELLRQQEALYLEGISRRLGAIWDGPITRTMLEVPVADALAHHAEMIGAALIVLSTHGRGGLARAWLGSVADRLIRLSPVPTLMVRPGDEPPDLTREPPIRHILIPLDGSPLAEQAIPLALKVGRLTRAHYTLVQVVEPVFRNFLLGGPEPPVDMDAEAAAWKRASEYLDAVAVKLRDQGLTIWTEARVGSPAAAILESAAMNGADLIAMTTHGRSGVARLLVGSVADKLLRGATVPLLIARPQPTGR
jgi:nucleotide-binding universal stress UspA family protein